MVSPRESHAAEIPVELPGKAVDRNRTKAMLRDSSTACQLFTCGGQLELYVSVLVCASAWDARARCNYSKRVLVISSILAWH